jgi:hypothetical protein
LRSAAENGEVEVEVETTLPTDVSDTGTDEDDIPTSQHIERVTRASCASLVSYFSGATIAVSSAAAFADFSMSSLGIEIRPFLTR